MSGASALRMMSLIAFGIFGFFSRGALSSSPVIRRSKSAGEGVAYGSTPVSIWYIVTPSE